jgi:hypothetical protein
MTPVPGGLSFLESPKLEHSSGILVPCERP